MDEEPDTDTPPAARSDGGDAVTPTAQPVTRVVEPGEQPRSEADRQLAETVRTVSRLEESN